MRLVCGVSITFEAEGSERLSSTDPEAEREVVQELHVATLWKVEVM